MVEKFLDEDVALIMEKKMPEYDDEEDCMITTENENLLDGDFENFGGSFDPATILIG